MVNLKELFAIRNDFLFAPEDYARVDQAITEARDGFVKKSMNGTVTYESLTLMKEALELSISLAVSRKQFKQFQLNYRELIDLYFNSLLNSSFTLGMNECFVLSCGLMCGVCQNDFRSVYLLEQKMSLLKDKGVPDNDLQLLVQYPLNLRDCISSGNFATVLKSSPPFRCFEWFLEELKGTIRTRLSSSIELSYKTCSVQHVMDLLGIPNVTELFEYIEHRNGVIWRIAQMDNYSGTSAHNDNRINVKSGKRSVIWELDARRENIGFSYVGPTQSYISLKEMAENWMNFATCAE